MEKLFPHVRALSVCVTHPKIFIQENKTQNFHCARLVTFSLRKIYYSVTVKCNDLAVRVHNATTTLFAWHEIICFRKTHSNYYACIIIYLPRTHTHNFSYRLVLHTHFLTQFCPSNTHHDMEMNSYSKEIVTMHQY